ncbi:MAG: deoxyribodipyrimidine photo-lyase [Alphaproteobacteria bacterium]|nr:deoxyribodipyrimidine photo-lyase [Alphaproteobacteria bacterium]
MTALIWFRQDLRLDDHAAVAEVAGEPACFLYVLDDAGIAPRLGGAGRWWLHHSLQALSKQIEQRGARLILRRGCSKKIVPAVAKDISAKKILWGRCYEPDAIARDKYLKSTLAAEGFDVTSVNTSLLHEPWEISTQSGNFYRVYTPFSKNCFTRGVSANHWPAPQKLIDGSANIPSDALNDWALLPSSPNWASGFDALWNPGADGAQKMLDAFIATALTTYHDHRNRPDLTSTSMLSPHLHFGEISPRAVWNAIAKADASHKELAAGAHVFFKELLWREFSYHLLYHIPSLPQVEIQHKFKNFPWSSNEDHRRRWQRGQTGYPIVDAGMRQLWQTGWMHNRVRMIVASFLIKHLHIDWRQGAEWFWDTLLDADLANNSASWQWVTGCGADAAPYYRIFNPMLQGIKFDPHGHYVKKFVPELAGLPAAHIHAPWLAPAPLLQSAGVRLGHNYPAPIVDHAAARARAMANFKKLGGIDFQD